MNRNPWPLRLFFLAAVTLAVLAGITDTLWSKALPAAAQEPFRALLATRPGGQGSMVMAMAAIYWLALLAAGIGLWRGQRWGWMLALLVTAVTLLQGLWLAPHAYSGPSFVLSYLSKLAWGVTLTLAWQLPSPAATQPEAALVGATR